MGPSLLSATWVQALKRIMPELTSRASLEMTLGNSARQASERSVTCFFMPWISLVQTTPMTTRAARKSRTTILSFIRPAARKTTAPSSTVRERVRA